MKIWLGMFVLIAIYMILPQRINAKVERDENGWTVITPSADSKIIYVSSSTGSDFNNGTIDRPYKSITKARDDMRRGYPDHLLLKCGDTWTEEQIWGSEMPSGRSADEPSVLSYYGDPKDGRPKLRNARQFFNTNGRHASNIAIIGIHVDGYTYNPDDPDNILDSIAGDTHSEFRESGIRFAGGGDNYLLEDCLISYGGIVVQGKTNDTNPTPYRNVTLRRNIVIDSYWIGSSTQMSHRPSGLYAKDVENFLVEENVFDHNGWAIHDSRADANMYNHNIYLDNYNSVIRNNILTRGSSHGINGKGGGVIEDNFIARNAVGISICGLNDKVANDGSTLELPSGAVVEIKNNVVTEGRMMNKDNVSWPRTAAIYGIDFALDNLELCIAEGNMKVDGNIVANRLYEKNPVESPRTLGIGSGGSLAPLYSYIYDKTNLQYNWSSYGISEWTYDFNDPSRSVERYNETLGGEGNFEAFIEIVRGRQLKEWDERYTAVKVNEYIRGGFIPTPKNHKIQAKQEVPTINLPKAEINEVSHNGQGLKLNISLPENIKVIAISLEPADQDKQLDFVYAEQFEVTERNFDIVAALPQDLTAGDYILKVSGLDIGTSELKRLLGAKWIKAVYDKDGRLYWTGIGEYGFPKSVSIPTGYQEKQFIWNSLNELQPLPQQ